MVHEAATLQLRGIGHRYQRGRWVLRDLDARWGYGRVVAVGGANGAGKSTLLRIVAGVHRPSAGSVAGRPRRVAYVPERLVAPPVGAGHWIDALAAVRGGSRRATLDRLEALGAFPAPDAPLPSLSKGTLRKVLLADALAAAAPLVVLDEPWADLDAAGGDALTAALEARAAGGALVVVTDHTGRAAALAGEQIGLAASDPQPGPAIAVTYRGDAGRVAELDRAAHALGFRRDDH